MTKSTKKSTKPAAPKSAKPAAPKKTKDIIPESAGQPAAKPAKKVETKAVKSPKALGAAYEMGEGKYNPRVGHNSTAWEKVQAAIKAGKGKATHTELCAALSTHSAKPEQHHHDFIGYMVRRDAIRVA